MQGVVYLNKPEVIYRLTLALSWHKFGIESDFNRNLEAWRTRSPGLPSGAELSANVLCSLCLQCKKVSIAVSWHCFYD